MLRHPICERIRIIDLHLQGRSRAPELFRALARNDVANAQTEALDREIARTGQRDQGAPLFDETSQRCNTLCPNPRTIFRRKGRLAKLPATTTAPAPTAASTARRSRRGTVAGDR